MPTRARARAGWLLCVLLAAGPARAQVRIDALTEVRSIRFEGERELSKRRLKEVVRTRDRGSYYWLWVALDKIPFVPGPAHHPFSPLELQQDVVRLRDLYAAAGFYSTDVRYDVERDDAENLLDITFRIEEGRPTLLAEVTVVAADSLAPLTAPPGEQKSWDKLRRSLRQRPGRRVVVAEARKDREQLARWWRDRGHPRAAVATRFEADSVRSEGRLSYRVAPGPSARFGEVGIEGQRTIGANVLRRQADIEPGEPYSLAAVEKARMNLQELDIVRIVEVDVPKLEAADSAAAAGRTGGATLDSVLPVRVRITEAEPRLVSGDLGYVTDGGVSSEARWNHRNFTGGGRSLTVTGLAQTGWLAIAEDADVRYRLGVSLKQPGFFVRNMAAVLTPFIEHRDDSQDRSTQFGVNTTLVYRMAQLRSMSFDYQIARRNVYEYNFEDLATGEIDLLTFLTQVSQGLLDSLGTTLLSSTFTLAGNFGVLDDPANPRRGVLVRPAFQVTAPTSLSSTAYTRVDAAANAYLPLGKFAVFATRVSFGRLFPFGKSLPGEGDDPQVKFLQLRDALFTAGGTGDARGWENRMLGPKFPDIRFDTVGDSLVPRADGYSPLGGFARASFSVELQVPLSAVAPNLGSHFFLDGGRVWTDDARFGMQGDVYGQEKLFAATGAGLDVRTPVGPIKVSVGYKLNPSITDLADADDVIRAANGGLPVESVERKNSRRWQWHLAFGTSY